MFAGIYKKYDYSKGRFEFPPYTDFEKRSVYHVRQLEVFRLMQLSNRIDIFMSHDWPRSITKWGDVKQLIEIKPHFQHDIENDCLGSPPSKQLLTHLQPSYWFAAHMHCRFSAVVLHKETKSVTKFLALDKCRNEDETRIFLEIVDINTVVEQTDVQLSYDLEWLTVLNLTNHLNSTQKRSFYMPQPNKAVRWDFTPTKEEKELVSTKFDNNMNIPLNFCGTVEPFNSTKRNKCPIQPKFPVNPQTTRFCNALNIQNPVLAAMTANRDPRVSQS